MNCIKSPIESSRVKRFARQKRSTSPKKLSAAAAEVLARPDVKEKLNAVTLIPVGSTPDELTKALAADTAFWQPIVKATGYKIGN